jgi:quercetin dioxygenase-like cupin family protein
VIENSSTGEQVEIVSETIELLSMLVSWIRPGHRAVRHLDPQMQERWEVLEGRAAFEMDGVLVDATVGTVVTAHPGQPHVAWNPTAEVVRLRIEMRPSLRWSEFVRRLFAGEDAGDLLTQFSPEVVLAPASHWR